MGRNVNSSGIITTVWDLMFKAYQMETGFAPNARVCTFSLLKFSGMIQDLFRFNNFLTLNILNQFNTH